MWRLNYEHLDARLNARYGLNLGWATSLDPLA